MSGKPWTEERRAAWGPQVRARWRRGIYAKRSPARISEQDRAGRSARMKALNVRMRDNDGLKAKCIRGQKRTRRNGAYRQVQAAVMKDVMARPEMRRAARNHCIRINKNPRTRRRQWATRRRRSRVKRTAIVIGAAT